MAAMSSAVFGHLVESDFPGPHLTGKCPTSPALWAGSFTFRVVYVAYFILGVIDFRDHLDGDTQGRF